MIRCVWRPGCHASVGGRWASFSFLGRSCQFVRLWQPDNEKEMTLQPPHKDWAKTCSFSPDSVHLVSGGDDRTLMVWNVESCQLVRVSQSGLVPNHAFLSRTWTILADPDAHRSCWMDHRMSMDSPEVGKVLCLLLSGRDHSTLEPG